VSPLGTAVLSGEIPSVDELSEDAADLSTLDIDRWSNISAHELAETTIFDGDTQRSIIR